MAGGRPSSFKEEYLDLAYKFALLGATDKQMANFFDVSEVTLNAWKKNYPEFVKSLKAGKLDADSKVVKSLFKRACGMTVMEEKALADGTIVQLMKELPPDATSCIFWLKNRQPDKWREKVDDNGAVEKLSETIQSLVAGMKSDREYYTKGDQQATE